MTLGGGLLLIAMNVGPTLMLIQMVPLVVEDPRDSQPLPLAHLVLMTLLEVANRLLLIRHLDYAPF